MCFFISLRDANDENIEAFHYTNYDGYLILCGHIKWAPLKFLGLSWFHLG